MDYKNITYEPVFRIRFILIRIRPKIEKVPTFFPSDYPKNYMLFHAPIIL